MPANTMAATTQLGVSSYLTTSLSCHNSWTFTNQSRFLSLQNSNSRIILGKLSIKSIAFKDEDHKLQSLQKDDKNRSLEQVKRRSREALLNSRDPVEIMKMIDSIQGLGISHHLEDEINMQLERICDWDASRNLFATSLKFRLLRHNGWPTCSDKFKTFLDKSGDFKESLTKDIYGMMSLYEASYLGTEDEEILKTAMEFSRTYLNKSIPHISPEVGKHIDRALTLPKHLRMARLEAKNYLDEYSQTNNQIPALTELAKLDFDMTQSLHRRELAEICRWWKKLGLIDKLSFARDRPTECFLWTVGVFPEPRYTNCRIELTKTICILDVIDDIFDNYGTLDELVLFTDAIKRWDLDSMEQLPEYMKICYMALYNTTNEISFRILKEHGLTVVSYLKRTEEQERGDNASSIECLMQENNNLDENESRKHIRMTIRNLWRELNDLAMTKTLPLSVVKASLNMARTAQVIYQHGDDKSTLTVDDYVQTLIFTSLPTSH